MSDSIDDGGPAYPVLGYYEDGKFKQGAQTAYHEGWHEGMSLRDYFAGHIVAGLLANSSYEDYQPAPLAMSAYDIADAMIVARKVGAK